MERDKFNSHVPDDVWTAVVPPAYVNRVLCLYCLDEFARDRGVAYAGALDEVCFAGDKARFRFRVASAVDVRPGYSHSSSCFLV